MDAVFFLEAEAQKWWREHPKLSELLERRKINYILGFSMQFWIFDLLPQDKL